MKKFMSFLLVIAVVMSFTTMAISVSADTTDVESVGAASDEVTEVGAGTDVETTGTSGTVNFEKPDKWAGTQVYCHIFQAEGDHTAFFGWQLKAEKCTGSGNSWAYDLSALDSSTQLEGGLNASDSYSIMFSDNLGNETCSLMFNTKVVGDTFTVADSDSASFENTEDSTKKSWKGKWKNNSTKYGIPLQITSVGTIQGEFIAKGSDPMDLVKTWDEGYPTYPSDTSYSSQSSARDHATRLKEIKAEFTKMIDAGEIYYVGGGTYTKSSSSDGSSSDGSSSDGSSSDGSSSDGSSSDGSSSDGSSSTVLKTEDGKTVTVDEDGNYVDEDGNIVDADDVIETTGTVSTGESSTYVFVALGVMLAAAGVYFLTRKKKA